MRRSRDYRGHLVLVAVLAYLAVGPAFQSGAYGAGVPPERAASQDDVDAGPAGPVSLVVEQDGAQYQLRFEGGEVFHVATGKVKNARLVEVPDSAVRLVLWEEVTPAMQAVPFYGISFDGQHVAKVRQASYVVRLWHGEFDPVVGVPPVDPRLTADASSNVYIVQFWTQVLQEFRDGIIALGGKAYHYMPECSYVVRMDPAVKTQVEALPYVRCVCRLHPAYRLEEFIRFNLDQDEILRPSLPYNVMVFEKGTRQKATVADRIAGVGGIVQNADAGARLLEAILTPEQILQAAQWDEVRFIDRWSPGEDDMDVARDISGGNYFHNTLGMTGTGVRAEVMDSGIQDNHVDFNPAPLIHGGAPDLTSHGTATYAVNFGDGVNCTMGVLPDATGIFCDRDYMSGSRYNHTGELVDPALTWEAVYQSNSWGSDRTLNYTTDSADMDEILFDHDILIFQSQSNAGDQMSRPQAWSKNILSVGGIKHMDTLTTADDLWCDPPTTSCGVSSCASIGPASDGRLKPDLAHFYECIDTVYTTSTTTCGGTFGGTSGATPITAGHGGLFFELWHAGTLGNTPGASVFDSRPHMTLSKAMLICSADQWTFAGAAHDLTRVHQGWGRVNVENIYDARDNMFWVDETDLLTPAYPSKTYNIVVEGGNPLRVVMTYADPPGDPAVQAQHRVNDLDLKVTSPDATVYWGNNGLNANMWSTSGGTANDKDTVECVFIQNAAVGTWTVEVIASEINQDGHVETPGIDDVDYALVVTGGTIGATPWCSGIILGEDSDGSATNNTWSKGNMVTVDTPAALTEIAVYLENVQPGTNVWWFVYESDTLTGTYEKRHESFAATAGGNGYFASDPMMVQLEPGKYYWLGCFWDQAVTYFYSNTLPGPPLYFDYGFGTLEYHGRDGTFQTLPAPATFDGNPGTATAPYWQCYTLEYCPLPDAPHSPNPTDGATDVPLDTQLTWGTGKGRSGGDGDVKPTGEDLDAGSEVIRELPEPINFSVSPDAWLPELDVEGTDGSGGDGGGSGDDGGEDYYGSLTTTFDGGNGHDGNMFDLTILNPNGIRIESWDGNIDAGGGPATIEVWFRTDHGSYVGHNTDPTGWTLMGTLALATTNPAGTPTPVAIGSDELFLPGETVGFYWTTQGVASVDYTDGPLGAFENTDLRFEDYGHGGAYPFDLTYSPRIWNGTIYYNFGPAGFGGCTSGIVDQSPPDETLGARNSNTPGAGVSQQQIADDFSIADGASIRRMTLWAVYAAPSIPPLVQDFVINIYDDVAGDPGTVVFSDNVSALPVNTGRTNDTGKTICEFDITLNGPFTAAPGTTYWLCPLGDSVGYSWAWQFHNSTGTRRSRPDPTSGWTSFSSDLAFVLCDGEEIECHTFGDNSSAFAGTDRLRGNTYTVSSNQALNEIQVELDFTGTADLYFYVLESETLNGSYSVLSESVVTATSVGQAFYSSGPIDVTLQNGMYYGIGVAWGSETVSYYRDSTAVLPRNWALGTVEDGMQEFLTPPIAGPITYNHFTGGEYSMRLCLDTRTCYPFGGDASSWSGADRLRGNTYTVSDNQLLTEIKVELDFTSTAELYFYVLDSAILGGSYSVLSETCVPTPGVGKAFYSSGPVNVLLEPGMYYGIGVAWGPESIAYFRSPETFPRNWALGTVEDGMLGDGMTPPLVAPITYQHYSTGEYSMELCIASCATRWDVYLDTSDPPTTLLCAGLTSPLCDPGGLNASTNYYWEVVASNCCGSTVGPVWHFTTAAPCACMGDLDEDNDVDGDDIQPFVDCLLTGTTPAGNCACGDFSGNGSVGMEDVADFVNELLFGGCP